MLTRLRSLQTRLAVLVVAACLPLLAIVAYFVTDDLADRAAGTERESSQILRSGTDVYLRILNRTQGILSALAAIALEVRDNQNLCGLVMDTMRNRLPEYSSFVVVDTTGKTICAPTADQVGVDLSSQQYVKDAFRSNAFTIGRFTIGRISRGAVLTMAFPYGRPDEPPSIAVLTALRGDYLAGVMQNFALDSGYSVLLSDQDGVLISDTRGAAGVAPGDVISGGFAKAISQERSGVLYADESGSGSRKLTYQAVADVAGTPILAVEYAGALEASHIRQRLIVLFAAGAVILLVSVVIVWWGGRYLIVRPVRAVSTAARRLADGDMSVRVTGAIPSGEIGDLQTAFNGMAETLERRDHELVSRTEELRRANRDLQEKGDMLYQAQKMETVGRLAGGIAHDFNNLLTVIIGNLQLLSRRLTGDERAAGQAAVAERAARRGAELTKRLLAFSRRQKLEATTVDVNTLVRELEPMVQRTIGSDIAITTHLAKDLWPTNVDAPQLENVLLNIAVNARDAMAGGGILTIETRNATLDAGYAKRHSEVEPGDYVQLSITDTGSGMPPEVLAQAFEPFFTTKEVGKGTGLGLSMAFGFVKQSGGHIKLYSELGAGTTVRLYLKRARAPGETASEAREAPEVDRTGVERILVVEDDPDVRATTVAMLSEQGYGVLEADGGAAALAIIAARDDIDLVFTDVMMPGGMNGAELARRAREIRPHLGILHTSGFTERSILERGILPEGTAWIDKPFGPAELAKKVRETIDQTHRKNTVT